MPDYWVTRQNGFYDTEPRVEIALGKDEISPGMLVTKYHQEGVYDSAVEAVENALSLSRLWYEESSTMEDYPEVTVCNSASIGVYPTSDDGSTADELYEWATKRDDEAKREALN